eukprot:SAG11_NODE_2100_length_3826_cov_40.900456_3_plen_59_part_00
MRMRATQRVVAALRARGEAAAALEHLRCGLEAEGVLDNVGTRPVRLPLWPHRLALLAL